MKSGTDLRRGTAGSDDLGGGTAGEVEEKEIRFVCELSAATHTTLAVSGVQQSLGVSAVNSCGRTEAFPIQQLENKTGP